MLRCLPCLEQVSLLFLFLNLGMIRLQNGPIHRNDPKPRHKVELNGNRPEGVGRGHLRPYLVAGTTYRLSFSFVATPPPLSLANFLLGPSTLPFGTSFLRGYHSSDLPTHPTGGYYESSSVGICSSDASSGLWREVPSVKRANASRRELM